jgi:nucleotide-binding universal stress UspA family protein
VILVCYDGSDDAKAAIAHAGVLLSDEPARVLTVWQPLINVIERTPLAFSLIPGMVDFEDADRSSHEAAIQLAAEGAELASSHGMSAQGHAPQQVTTVADAILSEAESVGASTIVMGSRGLTGLKSMLLGSVSHAVIQHADRAVIVVPSPQVAATRRDARHALRQPA